MAHTGRSFSNEARRLIVDMCAIIFTSRRTMPVQTVRRSRRPTDRQWQVDYGRLQTGPKYRSADMIRFRRRRSSSRGPIPWSSAATTGWPGHLVVRPSDVAKSICIDDDHWRPRKGHLSLSAVTSALTSDLVQYRLAARLFIQSTRQDYLAYASSTMRSQSVEQKRITLLLREF